MGDRARGDCKNVICSSDEDEIQPQVYQNSQRLPPATVVMMSRLNFCDKRISRPGTSGEAPAVPAPPTADDTDRQFWAEDEMSGSESRLRVVCRHKRRHSLAYRNRMAIRKRSRSLLCQSSSSNSDPAVNLNISPPVKYNVRRRRRCSHRQGPSATKKFREGNNVSVSRTPTPKPPQDSKTPNATTNGSGFRFGFRHSNSGRLMQAKFMSSAQSRSGGRRSQSQNLSHSSNIVLSTNNELLDIHKNRNEDTRPPSTSKRRSDET